MVMLLVGNGMVTSAAAAAALLTPLVAAIPDAPEFSPRDRAFATTWELDEHDIATAKEALHTAVLPAVILPIIVGYLPGMKRVVVDATTICQYHTDPGADVSLLSNPIKGLQGINYDSSLPEKVCLEVSVVLSGLDGNKAVKRRMNIWVHLDSCTVHMVPWYLHADGLLPDLSKIIGHRIPRARCVDARIVRDGAAIEVVVYEPDPFPTVPHPDLRTCVALRVACGIDPHPNKMLASPAAVSAARLAGAAA